MSAFDIVENTLLEVQINIWSKDILIVLACVDTIFFFCFDYVLYFNFVTDFSLWLTCRAKQLSSADVEGILGDDKDAYGDVKGVRKLAKKSGKVYKKRQK